MAIAPIAHIGAFSTKKRKTGKIYCCINNSSYLCSVLGRNPETEEAFRALSFITESGKF